MRLIDADALIEDVKTLWDYETVDGITSNTVLKQIVTDIQNAPTIAAPRWVRCEEEFPPDEEMLLLIADGYDCPIIGYVGEHSCFYTICYTGEREFLCTDEVHWWMPLPEPPKEGE